MKPFICFTYILLFFSISLYAQVKDSLGDSNVFKNYNPKYLKLSAEVKYVDSQYVLIPHLEVLAKDSSIQIHKRLYYDNLNRANTDLSFEVQRSVGCGYETISFDVIGLRDYDENFDLFRDYKYGDSLTDTIYLDYYCALEIGKYHILLSLDFKKNGEDGILNSEWYDFDIPFESKKGRWQGCKY
jgi:hypothetical protein